MMHDKLSDIFYYQKAYQEKRGIFLGQDRESDTKELILLLHSELNDLLNCVGWKKHRKVETAITISNIHTELIDILKYWLILSNIWNFTPEKILEEFYQKSDVVEQIWQQEFELKLSGHKIICIDLDGVLCDYVGTWIRFLKENFIKGNYCQSDYKSLDLSQYLEEPSLYGELKHRFREEGQKATAIVNSGAKDFLDTIKENYKIIILSSRPFQKYRRIYSDTIRWLQTNYLYYDAIFFQEDKRDWVVKYKENIACVIEDDPTQALRIAHYGVNVFLVDKPYNYFVIHEKIQRISDLKDIVL